MKNIMKTFTALALGAAVLSSTSCRDDFAEMNSNPSNITTPEASYLFTRGILEFEPAAYLLWYYNTPMMTQWAQLSASTGGYLPNFVITTANGGQGSQYLSTLKYVRALENYRSTLSEEDAKQYAGYAACLDVLTAYLGLADSDMFGGLAFTEACRAAYGGTLTPQYDTLESLYTLWLSQLDAAIATFTNTKDLQMIAAQDLVYGGDWSKWAKMANSLKLRFAARLINVDRSKALQIAQEVASASCGYIATVDDDMLFNKAVSASGNNNDFIYHWSNGFMDVYGASQRMMNFMLNNKDPRIRFCYQKNDYNSKVIQAFYDNGKPIPAYIEENVEYTTDANGKKTFVAWKGMGEPWVRYYGIPVEMSAATDAAKYGDWFDTPRFRNTDAEGGNVTDYTPYSMYQQQMIIGRYYNFALPKAPGEPVTQTTDPRPWYGLYLGAAEVNLYLAEFKLLGANLPESAESYYQKGLTASVQEYDKLAGLNQIAYYGRTYDYDPFEVSIELKDGEIETMLASTDYKLTGSQAEQLEKIYLQQIINFTLYPNEQFVTARRSGIPKFGSSLVARENYATTPVTSIPRRFDTGTPSKTDLMYQIYLDAYSAQGFTVTSAGSSNTDVLNSERVWSDKGNPQWGAGPAM
ncbi:MAG: SusD/RagB family nutrient-binding outer membrane lipoprotein [Parabacteroides sp.]|nr:SusD/RagB family nutrient-binding outer membrane lipoprotein [bacterium]MDY4101951.1 SusD/RagB family nutrient-binding outer membrane lipoprotein [Parabacteroides sp.]